MGITIFILAALIFWLFISFNLEIRHITQQLRECNLQKRRTKITNRALFKSLERLAKEINLSIQQLNEMKDEIIRRDDALKESVAGVSHDLRTPLTVLQGYLEMQRKEMNTDRRYAYSDAMERKISQIVEILDSFYDLSLAESNGYRIEIEEFDLTDFLINSILENSTLFQKQKLELLIDLPEKPFIVSLDKIAFQRILDNLFSNARRYAHDIVKIQLIEKNDFLLLTVSNQAENFSSDITTFMFEKYYQGNQLRHNKGHGLGLYTVKVLSEMMGIDVTAEYTNDWLSIILKMGFMK